MSQRPSHTIARLLVIEDDKEMRAGLAESLGQDHHVDVAADAAAALHLLTQHTYELVLVDVGLPDMDGIELIRHLRRRSPELLVLIVTGRDSLEDRVAGLESGADDYLIKPFEALELQARVRALLRSSGRQSSELRVGRNIMRRGEARISNGTLTVELPRSEATLLELLATEPGKVVSKDAIAAGLQRGVRDPPTNTAIDLIVHRLRRRIAPLGLRIRAMRGFGYLLEIVK